MREHERIWDDDGENKDEDEEGEGGTEEDAEDINPSALPNLTMSKKLQDT